jgi:alanine dehydrogenase
MKFALISEKKLPADSRVALSPTHAKEFVQKFPDAELLVESSDTRIFTDQDYRNEGIEVVDSVQDCDILLGIKEVPTSELIQGKTYLFFSHTIKMQAYNQKLMAAFLEKNITMIDYECLEWEKGGRVLGFGRWAGIVGAYNGLLTWGLKHKSFSLKPAYKCRNYAELKSEFKKVKLPNIKIALTGTGRVASGALEIMEELGIQELDAEKYLAANVEKPVFHRLRNRDIYYLKANPDSWDRTHFYNNHTDYACKFEPYLSETDLLINGFYWEDDLPALFTKSQTKNADFRIKVIADITCDVEGSIPITFKATSIEDPTFGWDASKQEVTPPYLENTIDVMAVTNLPTEMPASASEDFGHALLNHILPLFVKDDPDAILERATIVKNGKLCPDFEYLSDYAAGKAL